MVVYGLGDRWKHLTHLRVSSSDEIGLFVRDPALVKSLLQSLKFSGKPLHYDFDYRDSISFVFTNHKHIGDIDNYGCDYYIRRGKVSYCLNEQPLSRKEALTPQSRARFEALIRRLARLARSHSRRVSLLPYDIADLHGG